MCSELMIMTCFSRALRNVQDACDDLRRGVDPLGGALDIHAAVVVGGATATLRLQVEVSLCPHLNGPRDPVSRLGDGLCNDQQIS